MAEVVGDLPEKSTSSHISWEPVVTLAKDNPRMWVLAALAEHGAKRSTARAMQRGSVAAFRPVQHWEVATRNSDGLLTDIYVRYLGPS